MTTLLSMILSSILLMYVSMGLATVTSSQLNANDASKIAIQTLQYADIKANELRAVSYSTIESKAETKATITGTKFQREVTIGPEIDLGGGAKQRIATVNIYRNGETLPRQALSVPLSSQGSGSLPSGSIILWSGYLSAIPEGFQLCNGTNGSPDLRNRFVVGAGADIGTHIPNGVGGIASGYFAPGNQGGEEMHRLTIAEMPSHNHQYQITTKWGNTEYGWTGGTGGLQIAPSPTESTGGDQAHNIMPPYYSLAYIIKL